MTTGDNKIMDILNNQSLKDDNLPEVIPGSQWQHYNGRIYRVLFIANEDSSFKAKYPPVVVYINIHNNKPYARSLDDWHRSMTIM